MEAFAEAAASLGGPSGQRVDADQPPGNQADEDTVSGSDDQIQLLMSRNLLPERQVIAFPHVHILRNACRAVRWLFMNAVPGRGAACAVRRCVAKRSDAPSLTPESFLLTR